MTKQEFMTCLEKALSGLPEEDRAERLGFYGEMIDDRIEEGISEEEAVAGIGPVDRLIEQIVEDIPLARLVKERVKPKRKLKTWEIVLLALGAPVWAPLVLAAAIIILALYIVLWAGVVTLWAVELCFAAGGVAGLPLSFVYMAHGDVTNGVMTLAYALVFAGLAMVLFFGCREASKGTVVLTKRFTSWVKTCIIRRETK